MSDDDGDDEIPNILSYSTMAAVAKSIVSLASSRTFQSSLRMDGLSGPRFFPFPVRALYQLAHHYYYREMAHTSAV